MSIPPYEWLRWTWQIHFWQEKFIEFRQFYTVSLKKYLIFLILANQTTLANDSPSNRKSLIVRSCGAGCSWDLGSGKCLVKRLECRLYKRKYRLYTDCDSSSRMDKYNPVCIAFHPTHLGSVAIFSFTRVNFLVEIQGVQPFLQFPIVTMTCNYWIQNQNAYPQQTSFHQIFVRDLWQYLRKVMRIGWYLQ